MKYWLTNLCLILAVDNVAPPSTSTPDSTLTPVPTPKTKTNEKLNYHSNHRILNSHSDKRYDIYYVIIKGAKKL